MSLPRGHALSAIQALLRTSVQKARRGSGGDPWRAINIKGVKRERRVTVVGTSDGTYDIILNGVSHQFVASGNTAEQIRDGLTAAIGAGSLPITTTDVGTDAFDIVSTLGEPFGSAVSSPSTDLDAEDNPHGYMSLVANNVLWLEGNGPGIRVANEQALIIGNHISEPADNGIELATSTGTTARASAIRYAKPRMTTTASWPTGSGQTFSLRTIACSDSGTEST